MLWQKMRNFSCLTAVSNNLTFILPVDKCKISTGNVSSPSARPPATMTLLTWPLCCFGIATQVWLCLPTPSRAPNSTHVWRLQSYRHIPPENLSSVCNQYWIKRYLISYSSNKSNYKSNIEHGIKFFKDFFEKGEWRVENALKRTFREVLAVCLFPVWPPIASDCSAWGKWTKQWCDMGSGRLGPEMNSASSKSSVVTCRVPWLKINDNFYSPSEMSLSRRETEVLQVLSEYLLMPPVIHQPKRSPLAGDALGPRRSCH